MADYITLISTLAGLASLLFGGLAWLRASAKKEYASERDFEHLKRNYSQLAEGVSHVMEEIKALAHDTEQAYILEREMDRNLEEMNRSLTEQKAFIIALANRMEGIAAKLDLSTGGWQRSPNSQPPI